jgi:glutaredoxin
MARNTLILLLALLVTLPVQAAKLYKWVDDRGNVTYLDRPPPEGVGKVEEREMKLGNEFASDNPATAEAAAKFPVTLYMVPRCSSCDAARQYLRTRKVPFKEIDVSEKNQKAQEDMRKNVGDLAVPTLSIGSKVMKGYIESLLEGELDAAGYPKTGEAAAEAREAEPAGDLAPTQ